MWVNTWNELFFCTTFCPECRELQVHLANTHKGSVVKLTLCLASPRACCPHLLLTAGIKDGRNPNTHDRASSPKPSHSVLSAKELNTEIQREKLRFNVSTLNHESNRSDKMITYRNLTWCVSVEILWLLYGNAFIINAGYFSPLS